MPPKSKREERQRKVVSAKRRLEQHSSGGGFTSLHLPEGAGLWQVKQAGVKRFDVIPFVVGKGNPFADSGELHYERTYWVHRGVGAGSDTYCCPAKNFNKKCPICEYHHELKKEHGKDDDRVKATAPKERQLWNIIDQSDKEKGIQVWEVSYFLFGKMLDDKLKLADEEDGYDQFADPEKGFTLKVGFTEERFAGQTFYKCSDIEFKVRKEGLPLDLSDKAFCLDDMLKEISYDDLKRIFFQEGDEEEEEVVPAKKGKKPVAKDDDDDDGDEPAPKKKPVAKDDDDADEEDEEDDSDVDDDDDETNADDEDEPAPSKEKHKFKKGDRCDYRGMEVVVTKIVGDEAYVEDEEGEDYKVKMDKLTPLAVKDDDEDDEDEKPAKKGKKPVAKDDEDDEDDEPDDEDDEEEPAPKKKPGRPKKK